MLRPIIYAATSATRSQLARRTIRAARKRLAGGEHSNPREGLANLRWASFSLAWALQCPPIGGPTFFTELKILSNDNANP